MKGLEVKNMTRRMYEDVVQVMTGNMGELKCFDCHKWLRSFLSLLIYVVIQVQIYHSVILSIKMNEQQNVFIMRLYQL